MLNLNVSYDPGLFERVGNWLDQLQGKVEDPFEDLVNDFIENIRDNMEKQGFPTDGEMYNDIQTHFVSENTAIVSLVGYAAVHEFGAQWKMTKAQRHKIRKLIETGELEKGVEGPKKGWITIPPRPFIRPALESTRLEAVISP